MRDPVAGPPRGIALVTGPRPPPAPGAGSPPRSGGRAAARSV